MLETATFIVSISTLLCLHFQSDLAAILLYNESEKQTATDLVHRMLKRAIAMDGTITGEHGVGLKKREYLREELGEETVDAMRKVSLGHSSSGVLSTLIVCAAQASIRPPWPSQL